MDEELKRRIAASIDSAYDAKADAELSKRIEKDPKARAYRAELQAVENALRAWPTRKRSAPDWEQMATNIEKRLGETPWSDSERANASAFDPLETPKLDGDDEPVKHSENKSMSQPKDDENDDDLEGLAALTRTSSAPTSVSLAPPAVKAGPSLIDDGLDDSSGIVDLKQMAEQAPKALVAPLAEKLAPTPLIVAATPAPNASAEAAKAKPTAASAARKSSPILWMLPVAAAAAVGGFLALGKGSSVTSAPSATAPTSTEAPSAPAPVSPPEQLAQPRGESETALGAPARAQPNAAAAQPAPEDNGARPILAGDQANNGPTAAPENQRQPAEESAHTEHTSTVRTAPASDPQSRREANAAPSAPPTESAASTPVAPAPAVVRAATPATQAAPPPPPAAGAGTAAGPQPGTMNDLMVRALGGRQPGAAPAAGGAGGAAPAANLPETPSRSQVTGTLAPLSSAVRACTQGQTGTATVALVILSTGAIQTVSVMGPFSADAKSCIQGVVRRAHFPQFSRPQVSLVYPFSIQPPRLGGSQ